MSAAPGGGVIGCPHCPSRDECACPEGSPRCRQGACPCPPTCPCKQGCRPPFLPQGGPWPQRLGCLLPLLLIPIAVVVIITILISGDDDDGEERQQASVTSTTTAPSTTTTVAATTTTTTTTTLPAPPPTPAPSDPAPPSDPPATDAPPTVAPVAPLSPDMRSVLEGNCVTVRPGVTDDMQVSRVDFLVPTVVTGPETGETPGPLFSNDPALDVELVGVFRGGCPDQDYTVVVTELGGPPDLVQLSVGLDLMPDAGFVGRPDAPDGLGRIDGWDYFVAVEPDGTVFFSDHEFRPMTGAMFVREGNVCALLIPAGDLDGEAMVSLQIFRRDGATAASPVDWVVASVSTTLGGNGGE